MSVVQDRRGALLVPGILVLIAGLVYVLSASLSSISAAFSISILSGNKLRQLLELGSLILAFDAILICIRNFTRESWRLHFFPIIVAASSTILLVGFRFILGAGIGLNHADNDAVMYSGILHNPMDNYSYGAWITQAKQGRFTFFDLYTSEPHKPLYFNFLFLTLGTVARWLDAPSLPTLIVAGIAASAILVMIAFYVPIRAGLPEGAAKWSCVLAAFASGMSGSLNLIGRQIGINTPPGADLRYQDAILFSSFYSYPYHTISICLLSVLVLLIVTYDGQKLDPRQRSFPLFLISISVLLLNFTHPYEGPLLLFAYGAYSAVIFFRQKFDENPTRLWVLSVLTAITAAATLYNLWVAQHPVWNNFARISLSLPAKRSFWILGYGLVLPASILGTWISYRKEEFQKVRWMGLIPISTVLLLVIISIKETKIFSGAYFFMCILAGLCCHTIHDKIRKIVSDSARTILSIAGIIAVTFFFLNSLLVLIFFLNPIIYEPGLMKAAAEIRANSASENPLLLCDSDAGMTLPVLSGARVYSGHVIMTPDYPRTREELASGGFESLNVTNAKPPEFGAFLELLKSEKFEFVLVKQTRPAYFFAQQISQLKLVGCYDQKCLFTTPFTNHPQ